MANGRDFGTLISERRLALGYSLGQLANRVQATASEVRAWERGQRAPDDDVVAQLAAELALDPDELLAAAHGVGEDAAVPDADHGEPTAVVMSPAVTDAADTVAAEPESDTAEEPEQAEQPAPAEEEEASATEPEPEEPAGGQVGAEDGEPTAQVAASADAAPTADRPAEQEEEGPMAVAGPEGLEEAGRLADLPTEAVPVVAAPVAVAVDEVVAVQAPSRPIPAAPPPRTGAGALDPVTSFLRVLFDPDRRYLFWVRTVLIFVVFIVFFRVLAWAVPAFFDTLRDILDTIESTTTDTTLPGG